MRRPLNFYQSTFKNVDKQLMKFLLILSLIFLFSKVTLAAPGVVVLAGGGPEGDIGVHTDWSYHLYKKLIQNGDTTGDKRIKVVVLSMDKPDSNFMVDYLKSMGAHSSENLVVGSREAADDPKLVSALANADVLFIRGGNQGRAYQIWKDTKLHDQIKALADRGGAVGGTSSGSMGLSEYSITGGQDYTSKDVLENATSPLLSDEVNPNTSGIHNDFLNLVPGALVDTHCGERGRVARLLATQAKAVEEYGAKKMVGICLEEKTGIAIEKGVARVYGTGTVHFFQETADTKVLRPAGKGLGYTDVRDDALTEGWSFNFNKGEPDLESRPKKSQVISPEIHCNGVKKPFSVEARPSGEMSLHAAEDADGLFIASDAFSSTALKTGDKKRGAMQTYSLKKLYDRPDSSVVFLAAGSTLKGADNSDLTSSGAVPSMVLDCQYCTHKSLSSFVSTQDDGKKLLRSPALINMRIHILNEDLAYNAKTHKIKLLKTSQADVERPCLEQSSPVSSGLSSFLESQERLLEKFECAK